MSVSHVPVVTELKADDAYDVILNPTPPLR